MEIPTSWNDRGLLRHEPFLSAFDGLVAKKGGKGLEAGILADIVKGLKDKIAIVSVERKLPCPSYFI